jgi:hypothetical protein
MPDEWGDQPPTFDRSVDPWGGQAAFGEETDTGGGDQYVEVIGSQLWVAGIVNLGRFRRVSDFVNLVLGYVTLRDVVVLTRTGEATRLTMPELRILPDDIAVVGQLSTDAPPAAAETGVFIEKTKQRLVVLTRSHLVDGDVFVQHDGSIMAFVDATDPKFIPMTDVRVRWVSDRKLAAHYPFALLQRTQILGVATEGITLGGAESTMRQAAMLKSQAAPVASGDGFDSDIPVDEGLPGAGAARPETPGSTDESSPG